MFTLNWFLLLNASTEQHNWNCSRQPRSLTEALLTAESVQRLLHQRETQSSQILPKARAKQQVDQRRTSVAGHLSSDTKKLFKKKAHFHCDFPNGEWEGQNPYPSSEPFGNLVSLSGSLISPKGEAWFRKPQVCFSRNAHTNDSSLSLSLNTAYLNPSWWQGHHKENILIKIHIVIYWTYTQRKS